MSLVNLYEYPALQRVEKSGTRFYDVGHSLLPSVTTILSTTDDTTELDKWREAVGEIEAEKTIQQSVSIGTNLHNILEHYILTGNIIKLGNYYAQTMANMIVKQGLSKMSEFWGTECNLYYDGLYAGTADLVGLYLGKPAIIDFKNSRKDKDLDDIESYQCQGVAYALAHNKMYRTNIKTVVIMMMCHSGRYKEFVIEGADFDRAVDLWLGKLDKYYNAR